jgi:hypothetical protein
VTHNMAVRGRSNEADSILHTTHHINRVSVPMALACGECPRLSARMTSAARRDVLPWKSWETAKGVALETTG